MSKKDRKLKKHLKKIRKYAGKEVYTNAKNCAYSVNSAEIISRYFRRTGT